MAGRVSGSLLAGLLIVSGTTGCAAILDGTGDVVMFSSEPPGAKVVAGEVEGVTPFTVNVHKKTAVVRFSHPDHGDGEAFVRMDHTYMWGYLVLDILLTPGYGLVGCLVDGLTQAWWNPPDQVHYDFRTKTVEKGGRRLTDEEVEEFKAAEARQKERAQQKPAAPGRR